MEQKQINEQVKTIATQINCRELKFARFRMSGSNKNMSLTISKGCKSLVISLDLARDLYDIRKVRTRNLEIVQDEKLKGVFCDQVADIIEDFFKFEYINKTRFG